MADIGSTPGFARRVAGGLAVAGAVLSGPVALAAQPIFAEPEAAVAALVQAVRDGRPRGLVELLGPDSRRLVLSGDAVADATGREQFLTRYQAGHILEPQGTQRMVLTLGDPGWPMPIPLVHEARGWRFDAASGAQEIINRRIGRNELMTIRTLLSCVAAQQDYFDRLARGAGRGAFAERLLSTPGQQDGLFWEAGAGRPASPLGPLVAEAREEGYPGAATGDGKPVAYHGYYLRMLRAQGPQAPGGAKSYLRDGGMPGGFAIVAWPEIHANSGVMTFLVNHDGVVFQKDLGPTTAAAAAAMTSFDPDSSWARIDVAD